MKSFSMCACAAVLAVSALATPVSAEDASVSGTIRERSQLMGDLGVAYGRALATGLNDSTEDKIERAKIAYVELMVALHKAINEVPKLEFGNSTKGRALKLAYEKYLKVQNDNCRTLGLEYLIIIQDEELTQTERRENVMKLVERQVAIEKPHVETLHDALASFDDDTN